MTLKSRLSSVWIGMALILFFTLTLWLRQMSETTATGRRFLNPPPEHIELFNFGFNESLSDSLWLRWIQDADNCQTYLQQTSSAKEGESRTTPEARFSDVRHKVCDNSWSFKMLDAVTKLAPRFKMPYLAGGISLAVLTEDYKGASVLFNRGVDLYPDDWQLAYRAAYHFMIDTKQLQRAAELLETAAHHGAPSWVDALASRLYTESGQTELALRTLISYRKTMVGEVGVKQVEERIDKLRVKLRTVNSTTK